jgi:hypothetical protein
MIAQYRTVLLNERLICGLQKNASGPDWKAKTQFAFQSVTI